MRKLSGTFTKEGDQWWYQPRSGRRRRASEVICGGCGAPFLHASLLGERRFCSASCKGLAATDRPWAGPECVRKDTTPNYRQDDDGHWWYHGAQGRSRCRRKECERCGSPFPARSERFTVARFCSFSCRSQMPKAKGRKTLIRGGYALVHRPDHLAARSDGYVLEHRLVMEQKLGRPLLPTERVHHINAVRDDNRPENLELWTGGHPNGIRQSDKHCPTCTCGQI